MPVVDRIAGRLAALRTAAFVLALAVILAIPGPAPGVVPVATAAGTGVSAQVDAGTVELVMAWRRARGLDPPDAEADRRAAGSLHGVEPGHCDSAGSVAPGTSDAPPVAAGDGDCPSRDSAVSPRLGYGDLGTPRQ